MRLYASYRCLSICFLLVLQPIPIQLPEILPTKSALPQPLKVKVKHSISSTQYQIFNLIPEIPQSSLVLVHLGELRTLVGGCIGVRVCFGVYAYASL